MRSFEPPAECSGKIRVRVELVVLGWRWVARSEALLRAGSKQKNKTASHAHLAAQELAVWALLDYSLRVVITITASFEYKQPDQHETHEHSSPVGQMETQKQEVGKQSTFSV